MTAEELKELKELKESLAPPKPWWAKNIGTVITILVLGSGVVASYAKSSANVEQLGDKIVKIEQVQDKHSTEIENVKLKAVGDSSDIRHIKEAVDSMGEQLDTMNQLLLTK